MAYENPRPMPETPAEVTLDEDFYFTDVILQVGAHAVPLGLRVE